MVPKASSVPRISETITAFSSETEDVSSRSIPMAIPAIGLLIGTPASIKARQPPQTDAIEDDPLLSVMRDSTRIEYGNSSSPGIVDARALKETA
jgi:hypothetical protein